MDRAIVAGSAESADAAVQILAAGGNVVDAAVAGALASSAGDAAITSLAGGGILIYRPASTGRMEICDFFVDAPGGRVASGDTGLLDVGLDEHEVTIEFGAGGAVQEFRVGRASAAVPGAIPGLSTCLERWGSMPFSEICRPAVDYLRNGIRLGKHQASCFQVLTPILTYRPEMRAVFCDPFGELLKAGEIFRNTALADTLEAMGQRGVQAVYFEELVPIMVREFGPDRGGRLTLRDFESYSPEFQEPLTISYADAEVSTSPWPARGGSYIAHTLKLFEAADISNLASSSAERWRRIVATFRAVAELRSKRPDILPERSLPGRDSSSSLGESAASQGFRERLDAILKGRPAEDQPEPRSPGNTTHLSVVDRDGNAAGVTLSHGEGCGHFIGKSGIHMNNMLGEDDLVARGQRLPPGRLQTMMAPSIIVKEDGSVVVLGAGGSNRIRTAMTLVISGILDDGLDVESAVARGRVHVEAGRLSAETYAIRDGEQALELASHLVRELQYFDAPSLFFGGVHVACRAADGTLGGAGDGRRCGVVRRV